VIIGWFGTSDERRSGNDGASSVWSAHYPWDKYDQLDAMSGYVQTVSFDHYEQVNWNVPDLPSTDSLPTGLQALYRNLLQDILTADEPSFR
jgi:hypothetical protein